MVRQCINPDCNNFGRLCWDHCHRCGVAIRWKPKGMDAGIKYSGPKPLDFTTGEKHSCSMALVSSLPKDATYSQELSFFLHHGYPNPPAYYSPEQVEAMKDPEIKAAWNKQRAEWLAKYPVETAPSRYFKCLTCDSLMVKNETGICNNCDWLEMWWDDSRRDKPPPLPQNQT